MTNLLPNSNVDLVSDSLKLAGEQQITMVVLALPPKDSCKILVSLESRYGICDLLPSASALITLPSADSDLLMFLASSKTVPVQNYSNECYGSAISTNKIVPSAPVFETFSEPAKSTRYNFPDNFFWFSKFSCFTFMRNTECDLDECSFISTRD